jgi:hypothetical protein
MFNLRYAADYLKHRLKAKTRHGTHSPFVYRLVDKVIYDFHAKKVYDEVEEIVAALSVAERKLLTSPKISKLLYRLVADGQPGNIVELAASSAGNAIYLQKAAPSAMFYSVTDNRQLPGIINGLNQLDCVLIDAKQPVLDSFELCLPKVHDGTLLMVADIYRDTSTKAAWSKIKADQRVTITIDLFFIGLVYFRKGQVKEDFSIRF